MQLQFKAHTRFMSLVTTDAFGQLVATPTSLTPWWGAGPIPSPNTQPMPCTRPRYVACTAGGPSMWSSFVCGPESTPVPTSGPNTVAYNAAALLAATPTGSYSPALAAGSRLAGIPAEPQPFPVTNAGLVTAGVITSAYRMRGGIGASTLAHASPVSADYSMGSAAYVSGPRRHPIL